jgi:5-methylcytosine-specific restriction endonuclease McrA
VKRRDRRLGAALALVVVAFAAAPGWARWLAGVSALAGVVAVPVLAHGLRLNMGELLTPRRVRVARRAPYCDHRTQAMVRPPRPALPAWLRPVIFAADRNRCVACHARGWPVWAAGQRRMAGLELDHLIPYALGGLSWLWNFMTLCAGCNQVKSSYWVSESGKVYYGPWGRGDVSVAAEVYRRELWARRNPLRWLRMGAAWWKLAA